MRMDCICNQFYVTTATNDKMIGKSKMQNCKIRAIYIYIKLDENYFKFNTLHKLYITIHFDNCSLVVRVI